MILAAGRGERMGELTRRCPKPLLPVAGKPLLQHHLERLQAAGFNQVVINASYLGEQIQQFVETHPLNMDIQLSMEAQLLETGGGIFHALPLLGEQPFMVINGGSRKMVLNVAGDIIPKKFSKDLSDFDSNPYTRLCNLKQVFDYKSCSVFVSFSKYLSLSGAAWMAERFRAPPPPHLWIRQ